MSTKLIFMVLTVLSGYGTFSETPEKELVSVVYHMKSAVSGLSSTISTEKTDDKYMLTYHRESMEQPEKIEIAEADFRKMENWLLGMKKQGRKKKVEKDVWFEILEVSYINKGKLVTNRYESSHRLDKRSDRLMKDAISLMFELKDNYHRQFEIRIYYSKGIATPTEIYTYVEPAGLVKDLGEFLEKRDPNYDKQTGGSNDYSHIWRAVKPGIVKVWLKELMNDYDAEKLRQEYNPYGCYEIDENLMVKRLNQCEDD